MSNISLIEKSKSLVEAQKVPFATMAKIHGAVEFEREASFAMQALGSNSFLLKTASENPDSLKQAVLNVAAVGLTLSPIHKYAYLVPRDEKVVLDISYFGLIHLATEAKAIMWAKAIIVHKKDKFTLRGLGQEPFHEYDPFDLDRGEKIGVYCVAKTHSGEFLVETMTIDQVYKIRDKTPAFKAYLAKKIKSTPWASDEDEMIKKTVIRKASKMWPKSDTRESERFNRAINVYDQVESVDLESSPVIESEIVDQLPEKLEQIRVLLKNLNRTEEKFLGYLENTNNRKIEKLEELSLVEAENAIVFLDQLVSQQLKKVEETV